MLFLYLQSFDAPEEKAKFELFLDNCLDPMKKCAFKYFDSNPFAEEAVSDALLYIAEHITNLDLTDKERSIHYAIIVTKNKCRDLSRSRKLRAFDEIEDTSADIDTDSDIYVQVTSKELYKDLITILNDIDHKYKEVLTYRLFHQMRFNEIAALLGLSKESVKTRYYRGIRTVSNKLMERGYEIDY